MLPPLTFSTTEGTVVTELQLSQCAKLFSEHYGVWDEKASQISKYLKRGARVRMTESKLRAQSLTPAEATSLATCHTNDRLVGHAFMTTWSFGDGVVGWVTQLVVHPDFRRTGIATMLLKMLEKPEHTAFGLASSHPAACMALAHLGHIRIQDVDLPFIQRNAPAILKATPVDYLKGASLRGSLFHEATETSEESGVVSSVFTEFYVDHNEPLNVLKQVKKERRWPLGSLVQGHEFLVVVKARAHLGSKSVS